MRISVPDAAWRDRLADLDLEVIVWDGSTPQPDGYLDVALWPYDVAPTALAGIDPSRIGLVQGQSLGYDSVREFLPAGGRYANAVGVHEGATAELAMALLLTATRRMDEFGDAQRERTWAKHWAPGLIGRRIVLIGVGGIGSELMARLAGFGAVVVNVASTPRDDVHGIDELPALLSSADAVVIAVPLTESTVGLVDADFLARLPDGAVVVNVSRGKVVVTDAVVAEGGRIGFASDVFDPEPLPPDHLLWTVPHTIITPHVGGMSSSMATRVEALLRRQIGRLAAGQEPDHVVVA